MERTAQERMDKAREVIEVRRELDENEKKSARTSADLDADRVSAIRGELAKGGDRAVERRFGEAAVNSPEARQARTQQRAQQRRGKEAMERGVAEAEARRARKTPLRDAAVKQERDRQQQRDREPSRGR